MPADKDAAKRRRQARNRQERQNRVARTEGAKRAASRPSRTPEETPDRSASKGVSKTNLAKRPAPSQPAAGGFMGKLFPPRPEPAPEGTDGRPARTAGRPQRAPSEVVEVEDASGARGVLLTFTSQPGGRAAVLALLAALVAGVALFILPVAPPNVLGRYGAVTVVQAEGDDPTDTAVVDDAQDELIKGDLVRAEYSVDILGLMPLPAALVFAMIPVLLAGMAVRALTRPTRSRTLMICSIAGVAYVVLGGEVGRFFLVGVLAIGFAAYQSSKADRAALAASS